MWNKWHRRAPPPKMNTSKTTKKRKKRLISAYFEYKNVFYIQGFYVRKPIDNIYIYVTLRDIYIYIYESKKCVI